MFEIATKVLFGKRDILFITTRLFFYKMVGGTQTTY